MRALAVVGRDVEVGRAVAFVRTATGPAALLIEGEAGAGKTTVWLAALEAITPPTRVLVCRPVESEATLSFSGLGDLLGDALEAAEPELPEPQRRALRAAFLLDDAPGGAVDHRAVGAGTLSVLRSLAREGPVALAIDDVNWLDRPTARALGFALRRLTDEPVCMLATRRLDGRRSSDDLTDVLPASRVETMAIGPLSVGAVERLLSERLAATFPRTTVLRVHETSQGNPLFAIELARALQDRGSTARPGEPLPVPDDLQVLLLERVSSLPADARRAVLLASLASQPSDDMLAEAFGPGWEAAVEAAAVAGIVRRDDGTVRFAHPLLAAAVAGAASPRQRRDAHAQLAAAAPTDEARSRHLALATTRPDAAVASALEASAESAARRGATDSVAELAELAVLRTPTDDIDGHRRRCTLAGDARFAVGDSGRALALLAEAVECSRPGVERAVARWRLARIGFHSDGPDRWLVEMERARAEAGEHEPLAAGMEQDLAYASFMHGDLIGTRVHARAAVDLAERGGSSDLLAEALGHLALSEFQAGHGVDEELVTRARDLEDWDDPRPAVRRPTLGVVHVLALSDRLDEARSMLDNAMRELLHRGDDGALPFILYQLAELDCWTGHWAEGLERALDADRMALQMHQYGVRPVTAYAVALLRAHRGETRAARSIALEGLEAATAIASPFAQGMNASVLGFLALSNGLPARADELLRPLAEGTRESGIAEPAMLWWLPDLVEALVALGRVDEASAWNDWLYEQAVAIDRPRGLATAARGRALLDAAGGDPDAALAACDEALVHNERAPLPFERARTLFTKGRIARRARKWGMARASLQQALDEFEGLGASLWAAQARAESTRIGGRSASPDTLSETEQRVAELAGRGMSNRDIADALFMSPKTVSATVGRIYRKLGLSSRPELVSRYAPSR